MKVYPLIESLGRFNKINVDFKINLSVVWTKKILKTTLKYVFLAAKFRLDSSLF